MTSLGSKRSYEDMLQNCGFIGSVTCSHVETNDSFVTSILGPTYMSVNALPNSSGGGALRHTQSQSRFDCLYSSPFHVTRNDVFPP